MSEHPHHWTFLSNHAHVMVALARNPEKRLRDIAVDVGITERGVQRIIAELAEIGAIERSRVGRRNQYEINWELPLRHPLERGHTLRELLNALLPDLS